MAREFTPEQLEKLVQYASVRLHTTPEQLKATFQQSGLMGLAQQAQGEEILSGETAAQVEELLRDKDKAAALLNTPAVQAALRQLLGDG